MDQPTSPNSAESQAAFDTLVGELMKLAKTQLRAVVVLSVTVGDDQPITMDANCNDEAIGQMLIHGAKMLAAEEPIPMVPGTAGAN